MDLTKDDILEKTRMTIEYFAIVIENSSQTNNLIEKHKEILLNYKRIPNVINRLKKYSEFKIFIKDTREDKNYQNLLLLSQPTDLSVEIVIELNFYYFTHTEILQRLLPSNVSQISSFEDIGEIIHLNLKNEHLPYKCTIGTVLNMKYGKTIINKTGKIDNVFRNYQYEVLSGENNLQTIILENDTKIFIDLDKVYWCSRLQSIREKIINEILESGGSVCDPFCGVGPHILPLLKKGLNVYGNDLNQHAIDCLKKSLKINKLKCDTIYNETAEDFLFIVQKISFSYYILNLPEHSLSYIKYLPREGNFWLYCFFFAYEYQELADILSTKTSLSIDTRYTQLVRKVSPTKSVHLLKIHSSVLFK